MLDFESGRHANRIVGVESAGTAAGADNTEIAGGAGIGRTLPPRGSSSRSIMSVLYLAVPRRIISILFKIGRLLR